MNTFQGRQLCHNCLFFPSEKGSTLKGKNLLPLAFRVDPFSEGDLCAGKV